MLASAMLIVQDCDVGRVGRSVTSPALPLWPWRAVLCGSRIDVLRPFRAPRVLPLDSVTAIKVILAGHFEVMELLEGDGRVLATLSQWKVAAGFLVALGEVAGCEVEDVDGGHLPYGGG